jgi:hypothetical protein
MRPLIGRLGQRTLDDRQGSDSSRRRSAPEPHVGGLADGLQPGFGAVMAHRAPSPRWAGRRPRIHGCWRCRKGGWLRPRRAVERGIELAPFARGHHGAGGQAQGLQHRADHHRIGREHLAQQGHGGLGGAPCARGGHRAGFGFGAGVLQHRAGQHVLGLRVRGHAEAGHIDADDAHAVDGLGQQLQRHAAGRGHAQVDDDHRCRTWPGRPACMHGVADVLEQLAGDQAFAVEGHVAHAAARAVEMRGEGQAVDAAGRAAQDGGRARMRSPTRSEPKAGHMLCGWSCGPLG